MQDAKFYNNKERSILYFFLNVKSHTQDLWKIILLHINVEKDSERKIQTIDTNHLYSAGGIASAWHSNDAPEYNNAVVNRSGPTALIVGGSAEKPVRFQKNLKLNNE